MQSPAGLRSEMRLLLLHQVRVRIQTDRWGMRGVGQVLLEDMTPQRAFTLSSCQVSQPTNCWRTQDTAKTIPA